VRDRVNTSLQTQTAFLLCGHTKDNGKIICRLPLSPPQIVHLIRATSPAVTLGIHQMKTYMKPTSVRIPVIMEALVAAVVV
jgi:hypothetical protein